MEKTKIETSTTNKALIQALYDAILQGNTRSVLDVLDEGVEWLYYGPSTIPAAGYYYGKTGVLQFFDIIDKVAQVKIFEPQEYIDGGDQIAVVGFEKATSKTTGKFYTSNWVHVWSLKDGKITCLRWFTDSAAVESVYVSSDENWDDCFL